MKERELALSIMTKEAGNYLLQGKRKKESLTDVKVFIHLRCL